MFGKKSTSTKAMVHGGADPIPPACGEKPEKKKKEKRTKKSWEWDSGGGILQSKTFWGVVCLAVGFGIAFIGAPMAQKKAASLVPVVVLTQDVPIGTKLTNEMLQVVEVGAAGRPQGALSDLGTAMGQYVAKTGLAGDILTAARVTSQYPTDDPELLILPEGKEAMAVALDSLESSVASKLRAGDIIRLYAVLNNSTGNMMTAEDQEIAAMIVPELQAVEVLSVTNAEAANVDDETGALPDSEAADRQIATVVLAVNQRQAATLAGLTANAKLHASLVVRGSDMGKAAALAAQEDYFLLPPPEPDFEEVEATEPPLEGETDPVQEEGGTT